MVPTDFTRFCLANFSLCANPRGRTVLPRCQMIICCGAGVQLKYLYSSVAPDNALYLDSSLTMGPHTKATSKSCFYHIRSIRQIRSSMDHTMAISVASALVSSRLDYANSVLFGCPQKHTARLQRVQHPLARVVMQQFLHLHPPNFLNNFTGSPSNGESDLSLLV